MHHINAPEVVLLDRSLKGVWHEIFDCRSFSLISLPSAPEYLFGAISNFYENSPRYPQLLTMSTYDKLSPTSMLLDINYCRCCWHPLMRPCPGFSSIPSFPWYQRLINRRTPAMKHWQNTSLRTPEQQPKSISKKFEKLPVSKFFSFIAVTIRIGPNRILSGPGENDSEKSWSRKSRVGPPPCARPFSCRKWRAVRICQPRQRMSFSWSPCPLPAHNQIKMAAAWRNYSAPDWKMTVSGSRPRPASVPFSQNHMQESQCRREMKHIEEIQGQILLYLSESEFVNF